MPSTAVPQRMRRVLFAAGIAVAAALTVPAVAFTAGAAVPGPSSIEVTFTPSGSDAACRPPALGLSRSVQNTPDRFTVRIIVTDPLCTEVDAAAVIYSMPGDGVAWPQQLASRVDIKLKDPGVTEVRFLKGCDPAQFDVITGASPQTISPVGPWHGPLLFPFDTATTLQHWGRDGCDTTTTTTTTTTTDAPTTTEAPATTDAPTTTTEASATTEAPTTTAQVAPTTSEVPEPTAAPTTAGDVPVEVLPDTETPDDGSPGGTAPDDDSETAGATTPTEVAGISQTPPTARGLALTGAAAIPVTATGLLLVIAGGLLLLGTRRTAD